MDTYYTYISSYDVDLVQKDEIVKEHMLFLNINSKSALFRIIESFIIRCKIFKIPYNFKYSNNINNDSTLVIYSNTSLLAQYVYLLNDICSDNELNITISYPKLLSGIIDKFIGYESYISEDEELFTTQRLKVIYTVLDKELPSLYNNLFNIFISEHQYQTFKDYIFNEILSSKEKILERNSNNIFYFYKLKKIINNIKKINYKDIKNEEIKFGLKNKITIKKEEISELYIGLLNVLFRKYPEYVKIIVDEIKKLGLEYEIDNYTFCFDLDTIDKISLYELGTTIIPVEDKKMKKLI